MFWFGLFIYHCYCGEYFFFFAKPTNWKRMRVSDTDGEAGEEKEEGDENEKKFEQF